ncbi:MAG: nucleotidyltransferase domain-containing protein [Chloroflexi bacterium]|nr:nucleotidyltransferase domain-containing protein [Chloroflexota bacterium]
MLSTEIEAWLDCLIEQIKVTREVWLFGSRANETFTEESDWDFLFVVNDDASFDLDGMSAMYRKDVDLFVVKAGGDSFQHAWIDSTKSGSFSQWNWKLRDQSTAIYSAAKWVEDQDLPDGMAQLESSLGKIKISSQIAKRVWPKNPD